MATFSEPSAGESPVLNEQLELATVAPSEPRAVAVYCASSLGHQKTFQQAALCKSCRINVSRRDNLSPLRDSIHST